MLAPKPSFSLHGLCDFVPPPSSGFVLKAVPRRPSAPKPVFAAKLRGQSKELPETSRRDQDYLALARDGELSFHKKKWFAKSSTSASANTAAPFQRPIARAMVCLKYRY